MYSYRRSFKLLYERFIHFQLPTQFYSSNFSSSKDIDPFSFQTLVQKKMRKNWQQKELVESHESRKDRQFARDPHYRSMFENQTPRFYNLDLIVHYSKFTIPLIELTARHDRHRDERQLAFSWFQFDVRGQVHEYTSAVRLV